MTFFKLFSSFACIFGKDVLYLIHAEKRERSLVAEPELPKLVVRVRFPSLAPNPKTQTIAYFSRKSSARLCFFILIFR